MSDPIEDPRPSADLTDEAAAWLAALDAGSADMADFEAWRDADIRHAVAFAEVAGTWRDLDALRGLRDDIPPDAPVPETAHEPAPLPGLSRRHALRAAAVFAAVAVTGGGVTYRAYARDKAVTGVGERRTVTPASGIAVDLNTDSCLYWRTGSIDRLWIERGEVAIDLTAAHQAPVDLITPGGQFRLDPGLYNARIRGQSCELTVLRGHAVLSGSAEAVPEGGIALATAGRATLRARDEVELSRVTAWRHDTLILNGESLDYAVQEINRYLPDKIVIGDPGLSRLRLGGTFATTNPSEFLQALRSSFGVHVVQGDNGGIILTRG